MTQLIFLISIIYYPLKVLLNLITFLLIVLILSNRQIRYYLWKILISFVPGGKLPKRLPFALVSG